ncbi:MAG: hypothetical protein J6A88_01505 [Oscillospiraceae bacterium]|nr:hypothetical protein [Oscillospiraceae bacterium]
MSEREILNRQQYKKNRKKWILIQAVALIVVAVIALGCFLTYNRLDRTYYIEYTESSEIDYKVVYQENEYFDDLVRGEDQTYIAHLIDHIMADFQYQMGMDASDVSLDYSYSIMAQVVVEDKDTGKPYYTVEEALLPCTQKAIANSNEVEIQEQVTIDFPKFNQFASDFMTAYDLKNATATLIITMKVQMLSTCDQFEKCNENTYFTDVRVPLNELTMDINCTTSAPETESKVLAYQNTMNQKVFLIIGYVTAVLALLQALGLTIYMRLSRNEDVTYTVKVQRMLNSYSSYIQRIEGDFNDEGYQIINIKSFNELLGIRDTLQAPILMTENRDQTMSRFLIPTDSKMLYAFEIKVDNYDELYAHEERSAHKADSSEFVLK